MGCCQEPCPVAVGFMGSPDIVAEKMTQLRLDLLKASGQMPHQRGQKSSSLKEIGSMATV